MPMSHFTPWGWGSLLVSVLFFVGCLSTVVLRAYCNHRRRQGRRCRRRGASCTGIEFEVSELNGRKADSSDEDELCSICFDPFANLDVATGDCGHTFHCNCIEAWLAKDRAHSCPLCRSPFTDDFEAKDVSPV